jgi:amidophosphoribosyltransferase
LRPQSQVGPEAIFASGDRDSEDRPREACGVFGIYAPGEDVARAAYFGLYALQHRGQESAGIVVGDGQILRVQRGMGLVSQVFDEAAMRPLKGFLAVGHCRYATTGESSPRNAQPLIIKDRPDGGLPDVPFALAHNGNLVNTAELASELAARGVTFAASSDSEVILRLIAAAPGASWPARILAALPRLRGAFSLVMADHHELFAARDPWGIRPLCLGRIGAHWVVASESCALDTIGATLVRDVDPGELIRIDSNGLTSLRFAKPEPHLCSFEFIYFARPDSIIQGRRVYGARVALGRRLAVERPAEADLVVPVPDSAVPMAVGYAQQSGIPYCEGLVKNRYIGRTFIAPTQQQRDRGIQIKFNPLTDELAGRRLVVIEDSIVRGTTSRPLVALLRRAGATEVHLRIASPPYRNPCHLGMDTSRQEELIAARHSVEEICRLIGADSLGYLSLDGLNEGIGNPAAGCCRACLDGQLPAPIADHLDTGSWAMAACTPLSG